MLSPKTSPLTQKIANSFTTTTTTSSSTIYSMKIKSLIHNLLFSHICRLVRTLSKLKSLLMEVFHEARVLCLQDSDSEMNKRKKKMNKYRKKILFGSFRLHYNWCSSSHVLPINYNYYSTPCSPANASSNHLYYDSTWNSVFSTDADDYKSFDADNKPDCGDPNCGFDGSTQLSTYLEWLEEKSKKKNSDKDDFEKEMNEIDKLADMFIANCHEKFRLEKIESYRRYQEMLARSI